MKIKCCVNYCDILTCKNLGIAVFSFCLGMSMGLFFPPAFIAALETVLLLFLAYLCLFKW